MSSEHRFTGLGDYTRVQAMPPETTLAKATGHNHTTNNGQRKNQDSSGKGISGPGTIEAQIGQQLEIDGVRLKPERKQPAEEYQYPRAMRSSGNPTTPQEPNINQKPGRPLVNKVVGAVWGGIGIPTWATKSTLQQKQEKVSQETADIKEQHRKETADIKEQHRKETADIKEQHRKETADIKEQHGKQRAEVKEQHRKQTAEVKGQHLKEATELKKQLRGARSYNANLTREYNTLLEAYQREKRERERLLVENSSQVVDLQEHVKRFDRLAVVVENKKLYVGPQESDQKLSNAFEEIFRLVKRFSLSFLTEHQVSKKELNNLNVRKILQGIMTNSEYGYISLLDVKKTRRLLVQGIIAYKLAHCVFRRLTNDTGTPPAALDNWSKRNASAIDGIEQTLWEGQPEITARELNDWRAFTISLLSRAENSISETTTTGQTPGSNIGETIINEVMEWIDEWAKPQEVYEELQDQLRYILQAALDLSLQFRKQRAWWFVKLPLVTDGVIKFDPATMEDIDNKKNEDGDNMQIGKLVALVFFPGLYKCGDADGDNYHSEICIVKAQVKCLAGESASELARHESTMKGKNKIVGHPPYPEV